VYRRRIVHDAVQDVVPAHRRRALHVNLVVHGQRTCLPRAPQCPSCPLLAACPKVGLPVRAGEHVQISLAAPAKARAAVARRSARQ
jgi:adenine-specific DNA glycosylase